MKLTRRDALIALAGGGIAASEIMSDDETDNELIQSDIETLIHLADVLYPSAIEPTPEFIETYVVGRHQSSEARMSGLKNALQTVRRTSMRKTGKPLGALNRDTRDEVLRATGGDRAYPNPDGTAAQRIRYFIINDLLYALYATPKGGKLVGNPNPTGYPGGTEKYQHGPDSHQD